MSRYKRVPPPPEKLFDPAEWRTRANCRGIDPSLFFPERGQSTKEAKEVCAGCVVRLECGAYADATRQKHGIWAGESERSRRRRRFAEAKAAAGA